MKPNELYKRLSLDERCHSVDFYNMEEPSEVDLHFLTSYFNDEYANRKSNKWLVAEIDDENKSFKTKYFLNDKELLTKYKTFKKFTKDDRSSFSYWFAHWCGFNLTALNLGIWKFRYLFHDAEKPWLKLLWSGNYKKVQKWHRIHNRHHLEYGLKYGWDEIDWEALMIDWECCGLSKQEAQLDARETMEYEIKREKWAPYEDQIRDHLEPLLNKYLL